MSPGWMALTVLAAVGISGCTDTERPAVTAAAAAPPTSTAEAEPMVASPEAGLSPAAGGCGDSAAQVAGPPMINVYLVNAEPQRPRCLMEVYDFVCDNTRTWNLCGGEEKVIAICTDPERGGRVRIRIANASAADYRWVEYAGVGERDILKR